MADKVTRDITTGVGIISFPHLFGTENKNDKGETVYDLQFIIPKSQREDVRKIYNAIKEVGEAKFGENWKKVRVPLRDGDKEAGDLTEDGSTKGEKYPERLGCWFINARSSKPVGVYARDRSPIVNSDDIYAGCKVKVALSFYPYSNSGNHGIGAGLNGVQKISDGDPIGGGGKPSVESMFDMLEDEEDTGLDDLGDEPDAEPTPPPAKKAAAKKAPAKKTAAKKPAAAPEPEDDLDDLDLGDDDDLDDQFEDLDDSES